MKNVPFALCGIWISFFTGAMLAGSMVYGSKIHPALVPFFFTAMAMPAWLGYLAGLIDGEK
jgi:hypothetical protein